MKTNKIDSLINQYGFCASSYKWVLPGAEIFKYIGQPVMCLTFIKGEGADEWKKPTRNAAIIKNICNFNPETLSYKCIYHIDDDIIDRTTDIIPEALSLQPDRFIRFIPYSLHCRMVEDELFFKKLAKLYNETKTLNIDTIREIANSSVEEKGKTLKYVKNIGMAVKLPDENYLWIRIHDLEIVNQEENSLTLSVKNDESSWNVVINSSDEEFDFEDGLGKFKIIELPGA